MVTSDNFETFGGDAVDDKPTMVCSNQALQSCFRSEYIALHWAGM